MDLDPPNQQTSHCIVADSGATAHFCTTEMPVVNSKPCTTIVRIKAANGTIMQATHQAELKYPALPIEARRVYVVPDLAGKTLMSISQLCDAGCRVFFDVENCTVQHDGETVLTGRRAQGGGLWQMEQPAINIIVDNHRANAAIHENTAAGIVSFMHATMGYPVLATLRKAIIKGFLEGFPGLSLQSLKRYPPVHAATALGHMAQQRKNTKSTRPRATPPKAASTGSSSRNEQQGSTSLELKLPANREVEKQGQGGNHKGPTECHAKQTDHAMGYPKNAKLRDRGLDESRNEQQESASLELEIPANREVKKLTFVFDDGAEDDEDMAFPAANEYVERGARHCSYAVTFEPTSKTYADATGNFVQESLGGNKLLFVMYDHDTNYIFVIPISSTSDAAQTDAFKIVHKQLEKAGRAPKLHILDNQCGPKQRQALEELGMEHQLVPPGTHRRNAAERAIRTFKDHFISILCGTDPKCPINIWDKLVPQAVITLNLMRASQIDPSKSAYEQIHGRFNFNKSPMAPLGHAVLVHEKPHKRRSWDPKAVKGYYIGPAMDHYRCFLVHCVETKMTRVTDTVTWLPGQTRVPVINPTEAIVEALENVSTALNDAPNDVVASSKKEAGSRLIRQLTDVFSADKRNDAEEMRVVPEQAATNDGAELRVAAERAATNSGGELRVETVTEPPIALPPEPVGVPEPSSPEPTYADLTGDAGRKYRKERKKHVPVKLRENHATYAAKYLAARTPSPEELQWEIVGVPETGAEFVALYGHAINPDTNKLAEYRELIKSSKKGVWVMAMSDEMGRLMDGTHREPNGGTKTMKFVRRDQIPNGVQATYTRVVVAYRPEKEKPHRVRITVGGDKVIFDGDVSTKTADLPTVKVFLNSVVSTKGAKFITLDIKDFYLNTTMQYKDRVYMRIPEAYIPDDIKDKYGIVGNGFIVDGYAYVEITKGMYGLKQAGRLANEQLAEHLAQYGYAPCPHTHGLWKHATRPISFTLVVDDFGVKYINDDDLQHLIGALKAKYKISEDMSGTKYCGMTIKWDYEKRTVDLSMPGYIERALERFGHEAPAKHQPAPQPYTEPEYGAKIQYAQAPDNSPALTADQTKRIQEIIGVLLYYARAIDSTLLVALGTLASEQANGTEATMKRITHLLNYCASNPSAVVRFNKSEMILHLESDASYLCGKNATSRYAGYFYMSSKPKTPGEAPSPDEPEPPMNGAVQVISQMLRVVVSSAAEAELAGIFHNCKEACALRTMLEEMGHPQPPTMVVTDNSTAAGIANDSVKQKQSKAMDMRFYWVRDRVAQKQFVVYWKKGSLNRADYFTKDHPAAHHKAMRTVYLHEAMTADTYDLEVETVVNHYAMACEEDDWHLYMFYSTFEQ
jgi:Reverse transcriptase (RNA-dependent DNA polymerase)